MKRRVTVRMSSAELTLARETARKRGVFVNELLMMALSRLACEHAPEQPRPLQATSERIVEPDDEWKGL